MINSNWQPILYRCGVIAAYCSNFGHFAFLSHPLGGLRDHVRCSSWGHWKARSGLPISVHLTSFVKRYGWGATSEYRFKIDDFAPMGAGWPKIWGRRGRPINHFSSQKTRLNCLSYGIKIWTDFSSVLSHVWRTDGRTEFSSLDCVCIPCSMVKTGTIFSWCSDG